MSSHHISRKARKVEDCPTTISKRENVLVMRLAAKEQEVQEYVAQLEEMRSNMVSGSNTKSTLLDPAVNVIFQRMKTELEQTKQKLDQSTQEFDAWKFTPDSATGKRLMAKCRMLIQENEELGKITSMGRIAQLEGDLAISRKLCDDLKNSQTDIEAFLLEMEENMDGLQSTAASLQRQLDHANDEICRLRRQLADCQKAAAVSTPPASSQDRLERNSFHNQDHHLSPSPLSIGVKHLSAAAGSVLSDRDEPLPHTAELAGCREVDGDVRLNKRKREHRGGGGGAGTPSSASKGHRNGAKGSAPGSSRTLTAVGEPLFDGLRSENGRGHDDPRSRRTTPTHHSHLNGGGRRLSLEGATSRHSSSSPDDEF